MTQTHFPGMEPVPPSEEDLTYLKKYLNRLNDYLEENHYPYHGEGLSFRIRDDILSKDVYCYLSEEKHWATNDYTVIIPNIRHFVITIDEELIATYQGETGEVVYP